MTQFLPKNFDISSFRAHQEGDKIILEPMTEIPSKEHWLYKNRKAMASVKKGLEDIKHGRISNLDRDFSKFVNDDEV